MSQKYPRVKQKTLLTFHRRQTVEGIKTFRRCTPLRIFLTLEFLKATKVDINAGGK